ncbi:membrane protein [Salinarimonas ramus]|uniref:Membrane protein n=2 Tax=Salinarimonas ramus TaxID=690164 RepID=A0A917Q9G5_9HYPH|nr:membrane protein [Salinarimonas ramus]
MIVESCRMVLATRFDWDDAKAASNEVKHGISFDVASEVFLDPRRLDLPDDRFAYGEPRRICFGRVRGVVLAVVYTIRADAVRIISARKASQKERRLHGDRPQDAR